MFFLLLIKWMDWVVGGFRCLGCCAGYEESDDGVLLMVCIYCKVGRPFLMVCMCFEGS